MGDIPLFFTQSELRSLVALLKQVPSTDIETPGVHGAILSKLEIAVSSVESGPRSLFSDVSGVASCTRLPRIELTSLSDREMQSAGAPQRLDCNHMHFNQR